MVNIYEYVDDMLLVMHSHGSAGGTQYALTLIPMNSRQQLTAYARTKFAAKLCHTTPTPKNNSAGSTCGGT